MIETRCPGLPASWINGWLAAVGVTVLDDRIQLRWTTDGSPPVAVLSSKDPDPVTSLMESWPNRKELEDLPLADVWRGVSTFERKQKVAVSDFANRVQAARVHPFSWTLSSTLTDLHLEKDRVVAPAPFCPRVPGRETLYRRLDKVHKKISGVAIQDSLAGCAARVQVNGLGFDQSRLGSLADESDPWVDPVVEVLAFFGLALLPVRGHGTEWTSGRFVDVSTRQRGWRRAPGDRPPGRFYWPAWRQPLGRDGIDALMDIWTPDRKKIWGLVGVHAGWRTVGFEVSSSSDPTRGFGAERL